MGVRKMQKMRINRSSVISQVAQRDFGKRATEILIYEMYMGKLNGPARYVGHALGAKKVRKSIRSVLVKRKMEKYKNL